MGEAISLSVQSRRAAMPRRSRDRLGRLALLTPSCGGQSADREEKRVTYGNGWRHEEQLDTRHPNQRGHLGSVNCMTVVAPLVTRRSTLVSPIATIGVLPTACNRGSVKFPESVNGGPPKFSGIT